MPRVIALAGLLLLCAASARAQIVLTHRVLLDPELQEGANFGRTVAFGDLDGDRKPDLIVAANRAEVNGQPVAGRVHIYLGKNPTSTKPDLTIYHPGVPSRSNFGRFLKVADVNGDGIDDLLAPAFTGIYGDLIGVGRVFIYYGGRRFDGQADRVLSPPEPLELDQHFGGELAVGDVNADGLADIAVGSHLADVNGFHDAGKTCLFLGSRRANAAPPIVLIEPVLETYARSGPEFGRDVAIGDVNGDRIDDLVAGAGFAEVDGLEWAGRARVFFGGKRFDTRADMTLTESVPRWHGVFGWSIEIGDVTGDRHPDVLIGAPGRDPWPGAPETLVNTEGRIVVFAGGRRFDNVPDFVLEEAPIEPGAQLGRDQFAIFDVDFDGIDDVVAGAPFADSGGAFDSGRVQIFRGGRNMGIAPSHTLLPLASYPSGVFGQCVAAARSSRLAGRLARLVEIAVGAPGAGSGGEVTIFRVATKRAPGIAK